MIQQGTARGFRLAVLVAGAVWNVWLCSKLAGNVRLAAEGFGFEMMPLVALTIAAAVIRSLPVLSFIAVAHFGLMALVAASVIGAESSTAPVALGIATIASTTFVVLAALWGYVWKTCGAGRKLPPP